MHALIPFAFDKVQYLPLGGGAVENKVLVVEGRESSATWMDVLGVSDASQHMHCRANGFLISQEEIKDDMATSSCF